MAILFSKKLLPILTFKQENRQYSYVSISMISLVSSQFASDTTILRPCNDLVLDVFCQIDKIIGISRNTDKQCAIIFGMFSCVEQIFLINDIELNFKAVMLHKGTDKAAHRGVAIWCGDKVLCKAVIGRNTADALALVELGNRMHDRRRTVFVHAADRT